IAGSLLLLLLFLLVRHLLDSSPAPAPRAAGEGLVIPENAGEAGFGFLEGCWQSGGGIVNQKTQLPVVYVHCFGPDGTAQVTIDQKTGDGLHLDTCVSTAAASVEGGVLYIRGHPSGHVCVNNPEETYGPTTVVCRGGGEGGRADCVIEGSTVRPIDTPFTRLPGGYRPGGSSLREGQ
ncbi:MAG: hypothetical protein LBQ79_14580, partial [Deltaproteobacteria bacterium]|nr:hypothetical protein [Deltaproteobacteria bacterium]